MPNYKGGRREANTYGAASAYQGAHIQRIAIVFSLRVSREVDRGLSMKRNPYRTTLLLVWSVPQCARGGTEESMSMETTAMAHDYVPSHCNHRNQPSEITRLVTYRCGESTKS